MRFITAFSKFYTNFHYMCMLEKIGEKNLVKKKKFSYKNKSQKT